jgi:alpha/beta superfamily hydrolase
MRQSAVAFKSKGLMLEGVLASPHGVVGSLPGVVVCHPHPLFGGNMDNALVLGLCQSLVREGFVTFRFNFRGVGKSEGEFTKGEKEHEDVKAALGLMRDWPGVNRRKVGLAGYSFGAAMVLTGLSRYKGAGALALVSPPPSAFDGRKLGRDGRPKLLVTGDRDRLAPYDSIADRARVLGGNVQLSLVPGADHSWRGHEAEAGDLAAKFFAGALAG